MASQNLTAAAIESLTYRTDGPSRQVLWDKKLSGLGVRVTPANGKQFVLHYRHHGRTRLMSLGRVHDFRNVTDARDAATEFLRRLRREDVDPLIERRKQKAAGTVAVMLDRWLSEHVSKKLKATTLADYTWHVKKFLKPEFGTRIPRDVVRPDVRQMHARISRQAPYLANRVVASLRAAINWAAKQDDGTLTPGYQNPAVGLEFNREKPRDEHLRAQELPAVTAALASETDVFVRGYFSLLLLTSARKTELLRLRRAQVRLELEELVFDNTKNGQDFVVRLSAPAIEVLRSIPEVAGSEYVFPNRRSDGKRGYMRAPRSAWNALLKRAGVTRRVTIHDVRRSLGTALARAGYSAEQIAQLLNHRSSITARHYIRLASDTQTLMVNELGRLGTVQPAANSEAIADRTTTGVVAAG